MELNALATVWPHHGAPAAVRPGQRIFRDHDSWCFAPELPAYLPDCPYLDSRCRDVTSAVVRQPGWVYWLTPAEGFSKSRQQVLAQAGYTVVDRFPVGSLMAGTERDLVLMGKAVEAGERLRCEAFGLLLAQVDPAYEPIQICDASLKAPALLQNPSDAEYQPENQKWQGIPSIGRAEDGRLWATWYGGSTDENEYNWCVLYTSADDGATWQGPKLVVHPQEEFVRAFDPNLWTDPQGRLWMIWNQSYFHFDGRCGVWAMYTEDPGAEDPVWSEPKRLCDGIVMCDPVVLNNGDWLLPTAIWGWGICEKMQFQTHSNAYISRDQGASWSYLGSVQHYTGGNSCDENMIIQQRDGSLRMLIRTNLGVEESFSYDGGVTWSDSVDTGLTQVVSRFYITRLPSGRQLLVYNCPPEGKKRTHMTAALSEDDGKTWPYRLVLEEREACSYPDACWDGQGNLYIIYDRNRYAEMEILMAKVTEADIMAGQLVTPGSRLQIPVGN